MSYEATLAKLSQRSLTKRHDAYNDIPWDDADYRIDPDDPRWTLGDDHVIGATAWYKAQSSAIRARLGLEAVVAQMKLGVAFESILCRGLLELAGKLPNGAAEFRYAYHEVIEEAQHSLMFQELINRSGLDPEGLSALEAIGALRVPRLGRRFPELFFLFVLGGEKPIDAEQRRALGRGSALHPLLRRIMQIHVTEEARHLCFAESYLRRHVPRLSAPRRWRMKFWAPLILPPMAKQMVSLPRAIVRRHRIPDAVLRQAQRDPRHRKRMVDGLSSVWRLLEELDLIVPAWWRCVSPDLQPPPRLPAVHRAVD